MIRWFFVCLFSLLGARGGAVLTIDGEEYSLQQFYSHYPKKQWESTDSTKRAKIYTDFLKRRLCIMEAKKQRLASDPDVAVKIRDLSRQLLVNESYEQLVALPLIRPEDIEEARVFARKELFISHILVGYSGSYLAQPPARSIDSALLLAQEIKKQFVDGTDFSVLAEKYSEDPSAFRNSGDVGWVEWGATVPEFQSAAFKLKGGSLSDPVLTPFGYHLILVKDSRPSDYQYMSNDEYESAIINLSKGSIRGRLRGAATVYDSLQIEKHGVYFNDNAILKIVRAFELKQKEGSLGGGGNINFSGFLESITDIGVVCVYGGSGFGSRWFSNKLSRGPATRRPALGSKDAIVSVFKTIILQDIAVQNAYLSGVDNSFTFQQRKKGLIDGLLYDAYLKHIVNNISLPDTIDVRQYYNENLVEKFMGQESVLIREIRVSSRPLADSLLLLVDAGANFNFLAKEYSLINSGSAGLGEPFSRNKNQAFFDAVTLLDPGEITSVLSAPGNQFSILLLEEKIAGKPLGFLRSYSRIESLLTKQLQSDSKKVGVDGLFDKYSVLRNIEILK